MYLDANVFIYAVLDNGRIGSASREILVAVHRGLVSAATSAVAFDELLWIVSREEGRETAVQVAESVLSLRNLQIIDSMRTVLSETLHVMKNSRLRPQDALHVAAMKVGGIKQIVSEDKDFDAIPDIKRLPILEAAANV